MAITIQVKRDTAANWTSNNPTLAAAEFGFETDTGKLKLGDGSTAWSSLNYFEPAAAAAVTSNVQGSEFGYAAGGRSAPTTYQNEINKYSFTSDGNATDVGDLTTANYVQGPSSFSSPSHGYAAKQYAYPPYTVGNTIEKFPFASDTNATCIGDIEGGAGGRQGTAFDSTDAYIVINSNSSSIPATAAPFRIPGTGPTTYAQKIMKFPFASDTYAHSGGWFAGIAPNCQCSGAVSSSTHGYISTLNSNCFHPTGDGGEYWKFPFAISDAFATCVGDILAPVCSGGNNPTLTEGRRDGGQIGYQSDSNGYFYQTDLYDVNTAIVKFPFASDANATDVLALTCHPTSCKRGAVGSTSSTAGGYSHGGRRIDPTGPYFVADNTIDKFPFASDTNAADVGDLAYSAWDGLGSNLQN